MSDFHLGAALGARAASVLRVGLGVAGGFLAGEPGREERRRVEVVLQVAQDLGRGDGGGFVDGWERGRLVSVRVEVLR